MQSWFDAQHLWHPYTSLPAAYDNLLIKRAKGVYLYLQDGRALIDGMSSWWAVIHGYGHDVLDRAIKDQIDRMAHLMFGGLTHDPAINLGKKLLSIVPNFSQDQSKKLDAIFYADSGSVAVEVALKMALQYQFGRLDFAQNASNLAKNQFATTRSGYHGDTWHAMSVCDPVTGMHALYGKQLPVQHFLPEPPMGFDIPVDQNYLTLLEDFFAKNHGKLAGFILEPIIQGAGGMRFYHPQYLQKIAQLCQAYDILLIADEIATGFGRSGKMFACEHAQITPDILILGKALSGGYLTFASVICTKNVAQTIAHSQTPTLMHGPTFMANPLACAVSLASVELAIQTDTPARARQIQTQLAQLLAPAKKLPQVKDVRSLGAVGVIELDRPIDLKKWQKQLPKYGIWVRPFGKLVYIMPPYIITDAELTQLCQQLIALLKTHLA